MHDNEYQLDSQDLTEIATEIIDNDPERSLFVRAVMAAWNAGRLSTEQAIEYVFQPGKNHVDYGN